MGGYGLHGNLDTSAENFRKRSSESDLVLRHIWRFSVPGSRGSKLQSDIRKFLSAYGFCSFRGTFCTMLARFMHHVTEFSCSSEYASEQDSRKFRQIFLLSAADFRFQKLLNMICAYHSGSTAGPAQVPEIWSPFAVSEKKIHTTLFCAHPASYRFGKYCLPLAGRAARLGRSTARSTF